MKIFKNVKQEDWSALAKRPTIDKKELNESVQSILNNVEQNGDEALKTYAKQFDGADLSALLVLESEIRIAIKLVSEELKQAINIAKQNIEKFHG